MIHLPVRSLRAAPALVLAAAALAFAFTPTAALAQPGMPGQPKLFKAGSGPDELWDVTFRMEMPGMPMAMPAQTQQTCIKKGKSEKYIKNDDEFVREVLRRATENVYVLIGSEGEPLRLEGGELRAFLMQLNEFQALFNRLERRLTDTRIVEILANPNYAIDTKLDFANEEELGKVAKALEGLGLKVRLEPEEEHSTLNIVYHDDSHGDRMIGINLASQPEYRRMRILAKQTQKFNQPPFLVVKEARRESIDDWRNLIAYLKNEGTRDCTVQRYKGLGEMNPDQLWETTMNAEKRTLLQVRLEDAVECEEIFTTLMGENVEARRKFIEDNALDVRNLDV